MNAWKLSVLLVSIWTLLHFWLYPMLVKHWTSGELSTKVTRAGVLAGLEMLCNLTLRVAVVLGIVLGVLWLLDVLALSEHVFPQFAIAAAVSASTFLGTVSSGFSKFVLIASLAGAAFVLYRTARHAQSIVRGKLIEQVLAQRNAFAADPDSLFRLAEDENFRPQVEELTVILAQRDAIAKESPAKQEKRQEELQFLESAIEARLQTIAFLVVKPKFDPVEALRTADPSPAEPARRGMLPMIGRPFASKGFAKDLGLIRTSFDRVASALLVLSLLTWAAEPLANSFRLTANNLQVTFEKQAAKQLLDEALSKAQPAPAPPTSMESVNQATRTIARAFRSDRAT
jgi:hypothetical protein